MYRVRNNDVAPLLMLAGGGLLLTMGTFNFFDKRAEKKKEKKKQTAKKEAKQQEDEVKKQIDDQGKYTYTFHKKDIKTGKIVKTYKINLVTQADIIYDAMHGNMWEDEDAAIAAILDITPKYMPTLAKIYSTRNLKGGKPPSLRKDLVDYLSTTDLAKIKSYMAAF